jgi:hypothetical protein
MQPLTAPAGQTNPGPQAVRGRWIWRLSGVTTVITIAVLGSWAIVRAGNPPSGPPPVSAAPTRTITVAAPVTALNVQSFGAPIKVTTASGGPVRIAEAIMYSSGDGPPAVTDTDSHGLLTLAAPACANSDCSVAFAVTVPSGVTVTAAANGGAVTVVGTGATSIDSGGGPVYAADITGPLSVNAEGGGVTVNNAAGADLDSGGGPVTATGITGKLTVNAGGGGVTVSRAPSATIDSGGGPVYAAGIGGPLAVTADGGGVTVSGAGATEINSGGGPVSATTIRGPLGVTADGGGIQADDVTGALNVDTGGGPLSATSITSPSATVTAEGGGVTLGFSAAPASVHVDTGGGDASLSVPGGPYAVTMDGGESTGMEKGPPQSESVLIATSPGATRVISVTTDGGNLQIGPA